MGAVHIKSQKGHAFAQMFKTAKPFIFLNGLTEFNDLGGTENE